MKIKEKNIIDKTNSNSPLGVGGSLNSPFRGLGGRLGVIKICGMKQPSNIADVAALKPDLMGFIFYPKSPRYAEPLDVDSLNALPKSIRKIAVFVNETLENILTIVYKYHFDGVQLHGTENVADCKALHDAGLLVIKAFSIADTTNFKVTPTYEGACDYFLFDTKTEAYGGSGRKFDWTVLEAYRGKTPFLLSGGIAADDAEAVKAIEHPLFAGIDLNSKFETSPGLKDVEMLKQFRSEINLPPNPLKGE